VLKGINSLITASVIKFEFVFGQKLLLPQSLPFLYVMLFTTLLEPVLLFNFLLFLVSVFPPPGETEHSESVGQAALLNLRVDW
jgi:hypothetical protein